MEHRQHWWHMLGFVAAYKMYLTAEIVLKILPV